MFQGSWKPNASTFIEWPQNDQNLYDSKNAKWAECSTMRCNPLNWDDDLTISQSNDHQDFLNHLLAPAKDTQGKDTEHSSGKWRRRPNAESVNTFPGTCPLVFKWHLRITPAPLIIQEMTILVVRSCVFPFCKGSYCSRSRRPKILCTKRKTYHPFNIFTAFFSFHKHCCHIHVFHTELYGRHMRDSVAVHLLPRLLSGIFH